ncbi:hypothetical protein AQ505_12940 [Pedobacter sp. PACM 27299]|uniref:hypothetical protein n=1 Tax=Pedobacter sp. PACM 27299 TaxID=1727164 RepID=UPI00070605B3|nr:hypothetical protein [Pedobacter sp. PACM 27299]ALL06325.1 hypothetical protein AQ505_12940 [Pedobacter sp. PACM 27299]
MTLIINDMYDNLIQITDLDQAIEQVKGYRIFLENDVNDPQKEVDLDCIAYWDDIYKKLTQIATL